MTRLSSWSWIEPDSVEADSPTFALADDPRAARWLANGMSTLSEDCWCAGWLNGTEFVLWDMVKTCAGPPCEWGLSEVTAEQLAELFLLSEQAGGWCHWPDGASAVEFIPLADWLAKYAAWVAGRECP